MGEVGPVMDEARLVALFRSWLLAADRTPFRPLALLARWIWVFYAELWRDLAFVRAAGMAYATLVAIVPVLALVYGIAAGTGWGGEAEMRLVLDWVLGAVPGAEDILLPGLLHTNLATLGVVATAGLLLVAGRLYLSVERAYCDIFGVPVRRSWGARILSFYFLVTAVPILVLLAIRTSGAYGGNASQYVMVALLQYMVLLAALKMFPTTKVEWLPALLGAGVSWSLLEAMRVGLAWYLVWTAASEDPLQSVWGSLSIVPIFLLWLYLVWVAVLLGAEVAQVMQNYPSLVREEFELATETERIPQVETALQVMVWIAWKFLRGEGPMDLHQLTQNTRAQARDLTRVLEVLRQAGLLVFSEKGWVLAQPPRKIRIADVVETWRRATVPGLPADDRVHEEIGLRLTFEGTLEDAVARWIPDAGLPVVQAPD